jgi:hypothetical protein
MMNFLVCAAVMGNLASGFFEPDPSATTIPYRQDAQGMTVESTDYVGGTVGGLFSAPQNWSGVSRLGIRAVVSGENPGSFFSVEIYSGEDLKISAVLFGSLSSLEDAGLIANIELINQEGEMLNLSDVRGFQFTWAGTGLPVKITMQNFVDLSPPDAHTAQLAELSANILSSGGTWESLNAEQQHAYANVYPSQAVALSGVTALNLIRPSLLTEKLVSGYINHAGAWKSPYFWGGEVNPSNLISYSGSWPGWGRQFPVVKTVSPLHPAEVVGSVSLVPVVSNGRLSGYYYLASSSTNAAGVTFRGTPSGYGSGYGSVTFGGSGLSVIRPW